MVVGDFLYQLVFRHSFGVVINMESLRGKSRNSFLADVLQNQELQVIIIDGMKDLWYPDVISSIARR